jgi:hypothetical protein
MMQKRVDDRTTYPAIVRRYIMRRPMPLRCTLYFIMRSEIDQQAEYG